MLFIIHGIQGIILFIFKFCLFITSYFGQFLYRHIQIITQFYLLTKTSGFSDWNISLLLLLLLLLLMPIFCLLFRLELFWSIYV